MIHCFSRRRLRIYVKLIKFVRQRDHTHTPLFKERGVCTCLSVSPVSVSKWTRTAYPKAVRKSRVHLAKMADRVALPDANYHYIVMEVVPFPFVRRHTHSLRLLFGSQINVSSFREINTSGQVPLRGLRHS